VTSCKAVLSLAVLLLATAPLELAQAGGTYTTIDFPGANSTVAQGIDTAGDVVGWFADSSNFVHGFLFSSGIFTQLDVTGTTQGTLAYGINDVGQVVGGTAYTEGLFVYDIATQSYTLYQYSDGGYGHLTIGTSINNDGTVVGYTANLAGQFIGLELKGSMLEPTRIPGAYSTQLTSINNEGTIVAIATNQSNVKRSYLDQNGTFTPIAVPGEPSANAFAINDSNELQQDCTYANGINASGQVVGSYGCGAGQGFVWTPPADAGKK
jgi:uncharacterized membrane protein